MSSSSDNCTILQLALVKNKKLRRERAKCGLLFLMIVMVVFVNIYYFHTPDLQRDEPTQEKRRKTDAVILFSMMRSGSSIVGSVFNHRSNVTYLYEPLFPFGANHCTHQKRKESLEVIRHIINCRFERLAPLYQQTRRKDTVSECRKNNVCFVAGNIKPSLFMSRDAGICDIRHGVQLCPSPVDPVPLNKHCNQSALVAIKTIYLCKLEWLLPLLKDPDLNIKLIHIVRDPRPTIISRNAHRPVINNIKREIDEVCGRLRADLAFADTVLNATEFRNHYMRIRYEDFVLNPLGKTLEIYDFAGIEMNMAIKFWLDEATSSENAFVYSLSHPQDLHRNVNGVLRIWRSKLSFEYVRLVQENCASVLETLQYKTYNNRSELIDLKKLYFKPDW